MLTCGYDSNRLSAPSPVTHSGREVRTVKKSGAKKWDCHDYSYLSLMCFKVLCHSPPNMRVKHKQRVTCWDWLSGIMYVELTVLLHVPVQHTFMPMCEKTINVPELAIDFVLAHVKFESECTEGHHVGTVHNVHSSNPIWNIGYSCTQRFVSFGPDYVHVVTLVVIVMWIILKSSKCGTQPRTFTTKFCVTVSTFKFHLCSTSCSRSFFNNHMNIMKVSVAVIVTDCRHQMVRFIAVLLKFSLLAFHWSAFAVCWSETRLFEATWRGWHSSLVGCRQAANGCWHQWVKNWWLTFGAIVAAACLTTQQILSFGINSLRVKNNSILAYMLDHGTDSRAE